MEIKKNHAVCIDAKRGVITHRFLDNQIEGLDKWLHEEVHGWLQALHIGPIAGYEGLAMIVNEEGIRMQLPLNPVASIIYGEYIRGNAVILKVNGPELELFTMEEALNIAHKIREGELHG